jgi:hypothetical protein
MIFEESIYSRPFLQHLLLPSRFQSTRLPPFGRNGTGFELLQGIIIASDNDEKPKEAFQRVRSALTKAQPWVGPPAGAFPVPEEPWHIKEDDAKRFVSLPYRHSLTCVEVSPGANAPGEALAPIELKAGPLNQSTTLSSTRLERLIIIEVVCRRRTCKYHRDRPS